MSTQHRSKKITRKACHVRQLAFVAAIAVRAVGCQVLTYTGPNGERLSHTCVGRTSTPGSFAVEAGSNGVQRIEFHDNITEGVREPGTETRGRGQGAPHGG